MVRIGAHVGASDPVGEAVALGANAAQFFLGNPQSWKAPTVGYPGGAAELAAQATDADVALYVHSAYLINVAAPNNRVRIPSRKLLVQTVELAAEIGAAGVIVHGGHVTDEEPMEVGYENWRKALEAVRAAGDPACPILIENTAGGANAMARMPDSIARLWDAVSEFDPGFCFDTCHAWAAGIPLTEAVDVLTGITGRIDLVHANDSKGEFSSGRDRHASLGQGTTDREELLGAIRDAKAPVVLETPRDEIAADIALLRTALGE